MDMGFQEVRARFVTETTMGEDFAALSDDALPESMNLREAETGVPGTIFISTAMDLTDRG
jgi:hypothetical protein